MFCAKCGKQIPDGSAVCPFCGAPMAAPQAPQAAPVAPQAPQAAPAAPQTGYAVPPVAPVYAPVAPKEKKPVNKLPIIIGAIAAAAVIAIVLYLILHDGAKSLVKDYIKYQEKKAEEAGKYELESSEKALKALDILDDDDDDDDEVKWKVKGSKHYSGKDDEFKGLCAYIEKEKGVLGKAGETDKVSKLAIVEVKVSSGDNSKSVFYSCAKIAGKWYVITEETKSESSKYKNIKSVANYWADKAGKKSSNDDDDD